jgi:hypothetical protein
MGAAQQLLFYSIRKTCSEQMDGLLWPTSQIRLVTPNFGNRPHVLRSGATTAANPLCPLGSPSPRQLAKFLYLSIALPAPAHGVPCLARIRIYDDGLAGDLAQLLDEAVNEFGRRAIDADPDHLGFFVE